MQLSSLAASLLRLVVACTLLADRVADATWGFLVTSAQRFPGCSFRLQLPVAEDAALWLWRFLATSRLERCLRFGQRPGESSCADKPHASQEKTETHQPDANSFNACPSALHALRSASNRLNLVLQSRMTRISTRQHHRKASKERSCSADLYTVCH